MPETNGERAAEERRFRASLARRAIQTDGPLLAPLLDRHARAEGLTWEALAETLDATLDQLHRAACCYPPRDESFADDVDAIARASGIASDTLLPLLRRMQVTEAMRRQPAAADSRDYVLAARDQDDREDREDLDGPGENVGEQIGEET